MASRKLEVQIIGDASSLERAFGRAGQASSGFGSTLASVGKTAALVAGGAALGGIAVTLHAGYKEWISSTQAATQTSAVLKSTGHAANVTAEQVDGLARSLLRKTGVDDEVIKSGENMLLTFTQIQNRAGKNNDIFTQATKTTLDLSQAMGLDMKQAALQVGKALNDPARGMSRLQRIGVAFTDSQKEAVKAMMATGDTAGAQKVILAELNKEFGGSAEAFGKTMPGQINVLKESFNNLAGDIVSSLMPSFQRVISWTSENWPTIEAVFKAVFGAIGVVLQNAGMVIGTVVDVIRAHWTAIKQDTQIAWDAVRHAAEQTIQWYQTNLRPAIANVVQFVQALWNRFGDDILQVARTTFNTVAIVVRDALNVVRGVVNLVLAIIRGDWGKAWDSLKLIVSSTLNAVEAVIRGAFANFFTAAKALGKAVLDGVAAGLEALGRLVLQGVRAGFSALGDLRDWVYAKAFEIGKQVVSGILDGVGGFASSLKDKVVSGFSGAFSGARDWLKSRSPSRRAAEELGQPIGEGVIVGWLEGSAELPAKITDTLRNAIEAGRRTIDSSRAVFSTAFGRMSDKIFAAFDADTANHQTPAEKLIAQISDRRQMEDLQKALADAIAGGDPQAILRAQEDIQLVSLQKQADAERRNYEARRDDLKTALSDRLDAIQAHFAREGGTIGSLTKDITTTLKKYGIDFQGVGEELGAAFVTGLKTSIAKAGKGASSVASTIQNVANSIPGTGKAIPMASGGFGTVTGPTLFMAGEGGREDFAFSGGGRSFGGGGSTVINFSFPNFVGDKLALERALGDALVRLNRNGNLYASELR